MKKTQNKRFLILLAGLLLICMGIFHFVHSKLGSRSNFGVVNEDILIRVPVEELPKDTLYITEGRREYQRGKMTLIVPSLGIFTQVGESTSPQGLKEMPGLYEFSQLPDYGDVNVSIAGHRDIHDMVFYSLDKLGEGDYAYLLYDNNVYRYLYKDTKIVGPADWDVIKPQGFSCLTLTTCDPIGTTINRMIARLELLESQPFDDGYQFMPNQNTQP